MPITINEPTAPKYPPSIVLPTAGDSVTTATGAAPVQPPWTKLQSGVAAARFQGYGNCSRRVDCPASNTMYISPLGGVVVKVAGEWIAYLDAPPAPITGTTFDPTNGGAVTLANSTRYWVYVTIAAGALVFSISTTEPDSGTKFMTADESQLYVSTFVTNGSGVIIPYVQTDGAYRYVVTPTVLTSGSATVPTSVTLTPAIPSRCTRAWLCASAVTTGAARRGYVNSNASVADGFSVSDDGVNLAIGQGDVAVQGASTCSYYVSNAGMGLRIAVIGFWL
mgnify:CR=1 FL=1